MPSLATPVPVQGSAALRALARAFSHLGDFDRFVDALQAALERSAVFERTLLISDRELVDGAAHFSPGALTLPLSSGAERFGSLQISPGGEHRQFGAEDLHLMGGLADFLGAALGQSLKMQDALRSRDLLRFLLNQAPVGIAACGGDGRLLVGNDLATRWLAGATLPVADWQKGAASFHLRPAGQLVHAEARRAPFDDGMWLLVLHDLTGERDRLVETMKRETYRALAENGTVSFVVLGDAAAADGVLRRLPQLRAELAADEAAGPCDAHRLGLVLRGAGGLALRARLRGWRLLFGGGLHVGTAELGRDGRTPEALLEAALGRTADFDAHLRPALLVQDENPGVSETLALVLGRDFRIVRSTSPARTRELLAAEPFEGLVAELEPRGGPDGRELARLAAELQPGIQPFLTTIEPVPEASVDGGPVLIEKPFDVAALRQLVHARIGGGRTAR